MDDTVDNRMHLLIGKGCPTLSAMVFSHMQFPTYFVRRMSAIWIYNAQSCKDILFVYPKYVHCMLTVYLCIGEGNIAYILNIVIERITICNKCFMWNNTREFFRTNKVKIFWVALCRRYTYTHAHRGGNACAWCARDPDAWCAWCAGMHASRWSILPPFRSLKASIAWPI